MGKSSLWRILEASFWKKTKEKPKEVIVTHVGGYKFQMDT